MHLIRLKHSCMRCKKIWKKIAIEKWLLVPQGQRPRNYRIVQVPSQLGMLHFITDSGFPQQVFLHPSSNWTLLFDLLFTTFCNCNPAITHKVLSLQFNWVKYVRISKSSVCVCVCFLLQSSHMTKWLIPQQPLKSKCRHNRWVQHENLGKL